MNIYHQIVWRLLVDILLYSSQILRVHAIHPRNFAHLVNFCQWYPSNYCTGSDEEHFSQNAIGNFHSNQVLAEEKPHAITENHLQQ